MMMRSALAVLAQATTDDGLTFREILESLPSDPLSIITIILLVGSAAAVLWFGRSKGGDHT